MESYIMKTSLKGLDKLRFMRYVNKTSTCWYWTGACYRGGHGQFNLKGKMRTAHHLLLTTQPDTNKGECALHLCHEPSCVNPDHIYIGTRSDNNQDEAIRNGKLDFPAALARKQSFETLNI